LEDYSLTVGKGLLSKLLTMWGLNIRRKVKLNKPSALKKMLWDLGDSTNLIRNKTITKLLEVITGDITEITFAEGRGKAYLSVHKDILGQLVYGHNLGLNMKKDLVLNSLKKSVENIQKLAHNNISELDIIWHQDQGSQYTSYDYVDSILKVGKISYSRIATPTDNGGQESFFGRFKDECSEEFLECTTFEELQKLVGKKIQYYNNRRIHTSIGYVAPMKYTKSLLKSGIISSAN